PGALYLPPRRRALVRPGRAPHPGLPPILLHPRALPAIRNAGRPALGPDLLFHPRLFRGSPPRAPLLLRDSEAHARLAALERRGSGRVLLPALVRRRVPLLLPLAQQAAALPPPRVPRGRGPRRARALPATPVGDRRDHGLAGVGRPGDAPSRVGPDRSDRSGRRPRFSPRADRPRGPRRAPDR